MENLIETSGWAGWLVTCCVCCCIQCAQRWRMHSVCWELQLAPDGRSMCHSLASPFTRCALSPQVVDLRWGIREESQDDHTIIETCLQEIERCKKTSVGPSFVVSISIVFLVSSLIPPFHSDHEFHDREIFPLNSEFVVDSLHSDGL